MRVLRSVHVGSKRLCVHGVADVVEMRGSVPFPVEYKRGRPKAHRADEVQLCAQAICLEEMMDLDVPEGALFYGARRRRQSVFFDDALRGLTARVAAEARATMASGHLPAPEYEAGKCDSCSLNGLCQPRTARSATGWMERRLANDAVPE